MTRTTPNAGLRLILCAALLSLSSCSKEPDCPNGPGPLLCSPDATATECEDSCGCEQCSTPFDLQTFGDSTYLCTELGCYVEVQSRREFQGIETAGLTGSSQACDGGDSVTLRFVLMADDGTPLQPGEDLDGVVVDVTADDLRFEDTTIFEANDKPCGGACEQPGMACTSAPGIVPTDLGIPGLPELTRCQRPATFTTSGPVEFQSEVSKPQLFGVLYENSGSMEGFLPEDVGTLHPDVDGDGLGEGADDTGADPDRASDRNRQGRAALAVVTNNWRNAAENAAAQGRETSFGLWVFSDGEGAGVMPLAVGRDGSPWTTDPAIVDATRTAFPPIAGTRANVFDAMDHVLTDGFGAAEYADYDKLLVVFVDGPDDRRSTQLGADSVAARAAELGVRIFIVHLDAGLPFGAPAPRSSPYRDDPAYWGPQSACTSDAACKDFESCRVPQAYATSKDAAVDIDPGGTTYCMPRRDPETGRLGPIGEYARIACATEGGYTYVRSASGLRPRIDWLPFALDGLWSVDGVVDMVPDQTLDRRHAYPLQTTMSVSVGETTRSHSFSQQGEPIAVDEGADTRALIFQ